VRNPSAAELDVVFKTEEDKNLGIEKKVNEASEVKAQPHSKYSDYSLSPPNKEENNL
jgi:hypothetical protein